MTFNVAAIPAFAFAAMTVFLFAAALHSRGRAPYHTHRIAIASIFLMFGVNAFVAGLALVGIVEDQNTITFWGATTRATSFIIGLYVAHAWWTGD